MEISEHDKAKVRDIQRDLNKQITYISMFGCSNIKCKNCYLKGYCDHHPDHSMQYAANVIKLAKEKKNDNQTGRD